MTNEERDLISRFIERVAGVQPPPAGQAQLPLPPVDRDADALIGDLFARLPEARYRMTQMAFVQEHALVEAQNRISRLQYELQAARQAQAAAPPPAAGSPWGAAAPPQPQPQPQQGGGFFSSLFGGGRPQAPQQPQYAAPPPQYPQGYNPGMFQQQGPGFFGSALRTAAGVAGGVVAADALMGLFSGHGGGFGGGGFGGGGVERAADYVPAGTGSPWGAPPPGVDPNDYGGAPKDADVSDKFSGPADVDQSAWTPAPDQGSGWQDTASDQGSGWDQAGNDDGSFTDDIQNT